MKHTKKLIEVALPLEAINKASAQEKGNPFLRGHPRSLHQWWARRPHGAARAVIFAQMVDDPSEYTDVLLSDSKLKRKAQHALKKRLEQWETGDKAAPKPTLEEVIADQERERLFGIIEELVKWENTTNETVLQAARDEIWQSWRRTCSANADHPRAKELFNRDKLPAFHDPFAGGGALPLEAQRLGLEAYASDLNPVAVLINKALIEIPPKFAGKPPVNPEARKDKELFKKQWRGAEGLADDVRYYGKWMRDEAEKRIGHLYPKIEVTAAMAKERPDLKPYVSQKLTVIAWLWARTVKSPNPAFRKLDVPLASTFMISTKAGKEAYVEPVIEKDGYRFMVKAGKPKNADAAKAGTKLARGANFQCLMSGTPMAGDYIKAEGKAGRMGARLMAIVAEGERGRVYLSPTPEHEAAAKKAKPGWKPDQSLPNDRRNFWTFEYGLKTFGDLFAPRQLVAMTTFSDLIQEVHQRVKTDALTAGLPDDTTPLRDNGTGANAYSDSVASLESLATDKLADYGNSICMWNPANQNIGHLFTKHAIPMAWDFAEAMPLDGGLSFERISEGIAVAIEALTASSEGKAFQQDCAAVTSLTLDPVIATDPPYYDNIGYADLSDFFYVWLRRSLKPIFPELFATLTVPKIEELVATPYRHGTKAKAEKFFLDGMTKAMHRLSSRAHEAFPVAIYYAFKQSERKASGGISSTGWETFLEAVIHAEFAITGTWPMRSEREARAVGQGTNALASNIILVCRPRSGVSATATRREFVASLKAELPEALRHLQAGNIAPVDLAQAAIGPGMAVFTRYAKVLDAEGNPLPVREALALINQTLDEALAEQEGEFDADSRWALAWFDQYGFAEGEYGVAETLSKAKNTSVGGLEKAGILKQGRGKVRLLKPDELPEDWNPATDERLTTWETVHHLVRALDAGEAAAAALVAKLGAKAEPARDLAYRLYNLCERKKRAAEALAYNALVQSWPEIMRLAQEVAGTQPKQADLFDDNQ